MFYYPYLVEQEGSKFLPIGLMVEADMWREDLLFKVAHVLDESMVSANRKKPMAFSDILVN